jgi:glycyl-tRNA synthetase beta chain
MAKRTPRLPGTETLLVEILTEELPPKALDALGRSFRDHLTNDLEHAGLRTGESASRCFATPRRLAVSISHVRAAAAELRDKVLGPSAKAPAEAVSGFARKHGVDTAQLIRVETPKGAVYAVERILPGVLLADVLAQRVEAALKALPMPKVMRWGAGEAQFVRPVHGLVMLHGSKLVPGTVLGLESGKHTRGHRFMGQPKIALDDAEDYERKLRDQGMVIADFALRRAEIERQLQSQAKALGAGLGDYQGLLDEVTALVEHPSVYAGGFDRVFLEVPQECLILTMRQNQKCFPLFNANGKLLPKFLIVSNMQIADPRHIVGGNERVVRPRLEDARFFYDRDRKKPLQVRALELAKVVYYRDRLGSQRDRVLRIASLAQRIAVQIKADVTLVKRAAELSKADLLTGMVGEFPELQGIMGRYYALHDGEVEEVADAIEQHYRPRFAGDRLPEGMTACALALADKLETIAGMFGVGQEPSGDKDPFALRRHALGVVRILIEKQIESSLRSLVDLAIGEMPQSARPDWAVVVDFLLERAKSYFLEKGYSAKAIESVLRPMGGETPLHVLLGCIDGASRFIATEEGKILAEANKRITNILKKSGFEVPFGLSPDQLAQKPNPDLLQERAEIDFWNALQQIGGESVELRRQLKFGESLSALSKLALPTKLFFDNVLVNAEDPPLRDNRITLLQHARAYMNQVADLSLLAS